MSELEPFMKIANAEFFETVLEVLEEGGLYRWPDTGHSFIKIRGKLVGSKEAIEAIQRITPSSFHDRLELEA